MPYGMGHDTEQASVGPDRTQQNADPPSNLLARKKRPESGMSRHFFSPLRFLGTTGDEEVQSPGQLRPGKEFGRMGQNAGRFSKCFLSCS